MNKLIELIKKAGQIALDEQKHMTVQTKNDGSIVTNGDLKVSQFLEQELSLLYPDHSIYSEENYSVPKKSKVIVIDPIDGTESYFRKENTWSILIGFIENGTMVKGIVYQPSLDLLYFGELNKGSFVLKNNLINKLESKTSGKILGIVSHKTYGEEEFFKNNNITPVEPMFSAALKIMKVAEGLVDAYPNFRKQCSLWDLVAPMVILKEAGGNILFEQEFKINYTNPLIPIKFVAVSRQGLNFKI